MIFLVLPDIAEEDRLLAAARGGDEAALGTIYERYYVPVYQFIRMRVEDAAAAEDLASEVFMRMVSAFRTRRAPSHSLRGWLFRVARNVLYDHYGEMKKLPQTTLEEWLPDTADDAHPEAAFMNQMQLEPLRRALKMLSADYQEVIVLRFGQMLSLQETADIMGKSLGTIKVLQLRALTKLRDHMLMLAGEGA